MCDFFPPLVLLASFCALRDSISVRAAVKLCALPFKLLEHFSQLYCCTHFTSHICAFESGDLRNTGGGEKELLKAGPKKHRAPQA